jgi:hypothetical protein
MRVKADSFADCRCVIDSQHVLLDCLHRLVYLLTSVPPCMWSMGKGGGGSPANVTASCSSGHLAAHAKWLRAHQVNHSSLVLCATR